MIIVYSLPLAEEGLREIEVVHAICDEANKELIIAQVQNIFPKREVHYRHVLINEVHEDGIL